MNKIMVLLMSILVAGTVFAEDLNNGTTLTQRLFSGADWELEKLWSGFDPSANQKLDMTAAVDPAQLNPGKALMLSAIIPGAGEYYAGHKLKAALFLGIELAAWTATIYYYNLGQDKDKEFKRYADTHFNEDIYRLKEYELARNPEHGELGAFNGTEAEWREKDWNEKIKYLPTGGFTHDMPTREERNASSSEDQQYYEMIGKYINQFGFGWDDAVGDLLNTPHFDTDNGAYSVNSLHYMHMRGKSNQFLDNSALATQIVLLNHVASALDASFTVRAMRREAEAQVGFRKIDYDGHPVAVGGLTFTW